MAGRFSCPTLTRAHCRYCWTWQRNRTIAICGPSFPSRLAAWHRWMLATYADEQGTLEREADHGASPGGDLRRRACGSVCRTAQRAAAGGAAAGRVCAGAEGICADAAEETDCAGLASCRRDYGPFMGDDSLTKSMVPLSVSMEPGRSCPRRLSLRISKTRRFYQAEAGSRWSACFPGVPW